MSRVGKKEIIIPEKVEVKIEGVKVKVVGPKGTESLILPDFIKINQEDNKLILKRTRETIAGRSQHGTFRSLIQNMIIGVTQGWSRKLQVLGTGYKVRLEGQKLVFDLGLSHSVEFPAPEGIEFSVDKDVVTVSGCDLVQVGNTAAKLRRIKPPDAYKGKGIRYLGEHIKLKPGKVAKVGEA